LVWKCQVAGRLLVFSPLTQGELPEPGATPLGDAGVEEDITAQLPEVPTTEPVAQKGVSPIATVVF
jgi:hypothetical protein